jgi:hypothetical protein
VAANQYHFITRWLIPAPANAIFEILSNPLDYPRWWPSVYLDVRSIGPGRVQLLTRGLLPYTLRWEARTLESKPPNYLAIEATGDFVGRGIWSLVPDQEMTSVTFDWKITARKPLLQRLSWLLRPAFEANHRWAMDQGRQSLERELRRRTTISGKGRRMHKHKRAEKITGRQG